MTDYNKLTEGPIIKSLLTLAVPIILANILQTAYQLTDTFWVGRLGAEAVAAISLSFPIIFLLVSLGGGLAMAGAILVAQYKGKNDQRMTNHVSTQTMLMMFFVSIFLSVFGYFLAPMIMRLMGAEGTVFTDAVSYLRVLFMGLFFLFSFFIYQSLMRGIGNVKVPFYLVLSTVTLNLFLDPLFILGFGIIPPMGVTGAAIATIFTQGLAGAIGLGMLFSGKYGIQIKIKELKPDYKLIKKIFELGFPASVEQSGRALGLTFMAFLVASFGTVSIAAFGIGIRILSFVIIPALGFAVATSTLVGQNIGANKMERAEKVVKVSLVLGFVALTLAGLIFFLLAKPIAAFFIPGDLAVVQVTTLFIKLQAFTFGFIGIQMVLNGAFRGAGNTVISMVLSLISLWLLRVPLAYFLSYYTSLAEKGLWWAFPIANVVGAMLTVAWFAKGTWKKKRLTEEIKIVEKTVEESMIEEGVI